ncbi:MAG TPA: hypothetical protein VE129_11150 [Thermoanaerobaculia bacterium]|nr:hypothetical protein [Thermoanaerobaculia bacterium]
MTAHPKTTLQRWLAAIGLVAAGSIFLPSLVLHGQRSTDRFLFNDDARQWVVPFFGGAFDGDYPSAYFRALIPLGHRALYAGVTAVFDAEPFSKSLPYVLLAIVCGLVAATTSVLAGRTAAVFSVCLLLSTPAVLSRLIGGAPRAFAFPIVAAAAYGLAGGRPRVIAVATVAGAAFYPPAGLLAGATLAGSFFLRNTGAPKRAHALLLAITALLSVALLLPFMLGQRSYGHPIRPADVAAYPEAGPDGRYRGPDRPPFPPLWRAAYRALDSGLRPGGRPFLPPPLHGCGRALRAIALALSACGLILLARSSSGARRLLLLPAASLLLYLAAAALSPRLFTPDRYVAYSLVLLPAIAIPVAAVQLARRTSHRSLPVALCVVALLLLGGTGSSSAGLSVDARDDAPLFDHLARMPGLKLLAGWPSGPTNSVPYLSRKPALVTFEMHAAFHVGALEVMRGRMQALIDATFATSPKPLIRLRDSFGVTHLLVDRRHLHGDPPRYFAPFDGWVLTAREQMRGRMPEVERQAGFASVFECGPYLLLDLSRIEEPLSGVGARTPADEASAEPRLHGDGMHAEGRGK